MAILTAQFVLGLAMKVEKRPDGYYVTGIPDCHDIGPYERSDAIEHKRCLENFFKYQDEPGYITSDPPNEQVNNRTLAGR
jgi:hypothetical protein